MNEEFIVKAVVLDLVNSGYKVATEVPNFTRSADIAAIDHQNNVLIIECKTSNIEQALNQSRTHKLTADKVYIATLSKKMRANTINKIRASGIGLMFVLPDGSIQHDVLDAADGKPWIPARARIVQRILKQNNG